MHCSFIPGDKLVCRYAANASSRNPFWGGVPCPVELRRVYTCREVFVNKRGLVCIRLEEVAAVVNARGRVVPYPCFNPDWFEKLVDLGWAMRVQELESLPEMEDA